MAPHSSTLAWKIHGQQSLVGCTLIPSAQRLVWAAKQALGNAALPGESQGWGSLVGCRLWGHTDSDTTEAT